MCFLPLKSLWLTERYMEAGAHQLTYLSTPWSCYTLNLLPENGSLQGVCAVHMLSADMPVQAPWRAWALGRCPACPKAWHSQALGTFCSGRRRRSMRTSPRCQAGRRRSLRPPSCSGRCRCGCVTLPGWHATTWIVFDVLGALDGPLDDALILILISLVAGWM